MLSARPLRIAQRRGQRIAPAVALALAARVARAQVAVDVLELHVPVQPGATALTATFHAANPTDGPANATISVADWDRSERGENRYYPLGTLPGTCGAHVKVFPSVLRLEPRSVQTIRVTVDSADAVPRGCYSILFVEAAPPPAQTSSGLTYSVRFGVKLYVERDAPQNGEVTAMAIARGPTADASSDGTRRSLDVAFHNSGARQTETHGTVEIRRLDNSVATSIEIPSFPTLPGATRRLSVPIPPLAAGKYVLLALLDYGGQEIAAGQASLEVP